MSGTSRRITYWIRQALLFLVLISPSIIITYVSYTQLHKQLTEQLYAKRQTVAHQMALIVESRLDGSKDIGLIAADTISGFAEKGKWNDTNKTLESVSKEFPYIDRVFLTDEKGVLKAIYPPSPENIGKDFSFRDWYKGVSEDWQPYASEVFKRAPIPQYNTVAVAVPVKSEAGKPIGVFGMAMNLDSFYQLTKDFEVGEKGFMYIVNQKGQIVAHPKYPALGKIVDYSQVPVVQSILEKKPVLGIRYNTVEKENRLTAAEIVPKYNWGVVVAEPVATAFSERDTTLKDLNLFYGLLILLNCALAVIVLFAFHKQKELDKLKDEFVSIASHELRTPMTAIMGLSSMILEGDYGKINNNLKEPLKDIETSTNRLIHLVNDLLDMSRMEAGRLKIESKDVALRYIVDHVMTTLQPLAKNKGITLKTETLPDVSVHVDSDKAVQIISNMVGNALKFTDQGGITLSAKVEKKLVIVSVHDTGTGISKEGQAKLFGKFQQVSSDTNIRPQGTGLGLYISRELARKMGGDLWIEHSSEGEGSTFAVSIPLAKTGKGDTIK